MKRKVATVLIVFMLLMSMVACSNETVVVNVNVENVETINNESIGLSAMIEIGDGLWYNQFSRIVYWWNGDLDSITNAKLGIDRRGDTTPSAYLAPNGLPYRYNPETNTLEEIEFPWQAGVTEDVK